MASRYSNLFNRFVDLASHLFSESTNLQAMSTLVFFFKLTRGRNLIVLHQGRRWMTFQFDREVEGEGVMNLHTPIQYLISELNRLFRSRQRGKEAKQFMFENDQKKLYPIGSQVKWKGLDSFIPPFCSFDVARL